MRITSLATFLAIFSAVCFAQTTLTNDAILKMAKAGLGEDIILSTVKAQPGTYSTGPDDLIALKNAGVSDKVIAAMMEKTARGRHRPPKPPRPVAAGGGSGQRSRRLFQEGGRLGGSAARGRQLQNRRRSEEHRHRRDRQGRRQRPREWRTQPDSTEDPDRAACVRSRRHRHYRIPVIALAHVRRIGANSGPSPAASCMFPAARPATSFRSRARRPRRAPTKSCFRISGPANMVSCPRRRRSHRFLRPHRQDLFVPV